MARAAKRACGKKVYLTWEHASHDAKVMRRKGFPEQVYHCRQCQCWHVGTNLKPKIHDEKVRMTMAARRGRPMKAEAYREPNGRASRARDPIDRLALEARAKMLGISVLDAKNQLAATFIGRLHMSYQAWEKRGPKDVPRPSECLSTREYNAAVRFLELRNDRLKVIQAEGAQYDKRPTGDADPDAVEEWAKRVNGDYQAVRDAIQEAQNVNRSENLWAALDYCIIRDQPFSHMVGALRILCNSMARHWKIS